MNILVLGGTGAMGVHLVEFLSQRGDAVFVTSRRERPSRKNVTYIRGDAHDNVFYRLCSIAGDGMRLSISWSIGQGSSDTVCRSCLPPPHNMSF